MVRFITKNRKNIFTPLSLTFQMHIKANYFYKHSIHFVIIEKAIGCDHSQPDQFDYQRARLKACWLIMYGI
jgi:hypothetical protein